MLIALLLLVTCAALSMLVTVIARTPLLRTLLLSFDGWAEAARSESGEMS